MPTGCLLDAGGMTTAICITSTRLPDEQDGKNPQVSSARCWRNDLPILPKLSEREQNCSTPTGRNTAAIAWVRHFASGAGG
jgi:hypothetical protein